MFFQVSAGAAALTAAVMLALTPAAAFDDAKYPEWKGQWTRVPVPGYPGQPPHDPSMPPGRGQGAPLTPEYQAVFEANLLDQKAGGQGGESATYACLPNGMSRMMTPYEPIEFVVTPDTTYVLIEHIEHDRRIYTDGREWPEEVEPTFGGYSIGHWIDEDGDGRYDVLEVETRFLKGPRAYDATGIPFHKDGQTVIKERIYLDRSNPGIMHNEITSIDHALMRPWTVTKNYRRTAGARPDWREWICGENNNHIVVGKDDYFISADGYLMPVRRDQPPPDLRYFGQPRK